MIRAGFSVPNGFVVNVRGVEAVAVGPKLRRAAAMREVRAMLRENFREGDYVAVRSSAVIEDGEASSFAGMFSTFLGLPATERAIGSAITECVISAQSEKLKAYAAMRRHALNNVELAVIVQKMIACEVSGVAFSRDRSAGDASIVIEAVVGTGEALVAGKHIPTRFVIPRGTGEEARLLLSKMKRKGRPIVGLTRGLVGELCSATLRLEELFGSGQDVEWCLSGSSLFILQARPITAPLRNT